MSSRVRARLHLIWLIPALLLAAPALSCGDDSDNGTTAASPTAKKINTVAEQAARLAAETQLRSAQSAQDTYFLRHQTYAATAEQLRSAGVPLSPKVTVVSGDGKGYEISVVVNDGDGTKLTVRKTDTGVDRTDSRGNSW